MPSSDLVSVHVRIEPDLRARIGIFAEVAGVSANTAISDALEEAFGAVPLPEADYRDAVLGARGKGEDRDD